LTVSTANHIQVRGGEKLVEREDKKRERSKIGMTEERGERKGQKKRGWKGAVKKKKHLTLINDTGPGTGGDMSQKGRYPKAGFRREKVEKKKKL